MKKKATKVAATTAVVLGFASNSFAQATSSATAFVISPIAIAKKVDMSFGSIIVASGTGGTVELAPAGTRITGGDGGVTLPTAAGTVSAANFTVTGHPNYTFAITLPPAVTLTDGSGHTITVDGFTSFPSATGTLSPGGTEDLKVGATIILTASQPFGAYTNTSGVRMSVNYN